MMLSVCMITYNHEKYIAQAIEGVLMQKTKFAFELIIGEDNSTDKTREICINFRNNNSDKINLTLNDSNLGMICNFIETYKKCKGKYIAFCEGDDYWTDLFKLQKQVDFLEANPEFTLSFHSVSCINENGKTTRVLPENLSKSILSIADLALGNFIPTVSCIHRNGPINSFPEFVFNAPAIDYIFHLLNTKNGRIGYINSNMGVYREHNGGVWSSLSENIKNERLIDGVLVPILQHLPTNVQALIKIQINHQIINIIRNYINEKDNNNIERIFEKYKYLMDADFLVNLLKDKENIEKNYINIVNSTSYKIGRNIVKLLNKIMCKKRN